MADLNFTSSADNITAQVTEPEIIATTSVGNIVITNAAGKEKELSVSTTNLGEENVPDPTLYYRKNDYLSIVIGQIYLEILKQLGASENINTADALVALLEKGIQDLLATSEELQNNTEKILEDLVDATDDFYGLANIDDDQIATVQKVLADYLLGLSDISTKTINKVVEISILSTAIDSKLVEKVLQDSLVNIPDVFTRVVNYIRVFSDTQQVTDQPSKLINRICDSISTNLAREDVRYILVNLQKLDNVQVTTTFKTVTNFIRIFTDSVDATDDFYGLANIDDDQIASFNKVLIDQTALIDSFTRQVDFYRSFNSSTTAIIESDSKTIGPSYIDQTTNTESIVKTIGPELQDQFVGTEQQIFDVSKVLENIINPTDDFYGLANIDDDQIASFQKVLTDYLTGIVEFVELELDVPFTDQTILTDQTNLLLDAIYLDQIQLAQENNKILEKSVIEQVSLTEADNKDYTKLNSDQIVASETNIKTIGKNPEENFSVLDNYTLLAIDKLILDQTQLQETIDFLRVTTVYYYDQVDATDDFYGLANIDDDQLASVGKVLASNTSGATDFSTREIQPNKVDNVATTESRSAHIQDYFLEEYVDYTQRYVGTTITI